MFAPFETPQIAIAVQCENTGDGSHCAAPIASLLAEFYLEARAARFLLVCARGCFVLEMPCKCDSVRLSM